MAEKSPKITILTWFFSIFWKKLAKSRKFAERKSLLLAIEKLEKILWVFFFFFFFFGWGSRKLKIPKTLNFLMFNFWVGFLAHNFPVKIKRLPVGGIYYLGTFQRRAHKGRYQLGMKDKSLIILLFFSLYRRKSKYRNLMIFYYFFLMSFENWFFCGESYFICIEISWFSLIKKKVFW